MDGQQSSSWQNQEVELHKAGYKSAVLISPVVADTVTLRLQRSCGIVQRVPGWSCLEAAGVGTSDCIGAQPDVVQASKTLPIGLLD